MSAVLSDGTKSFVGDGLGAGFAEVTGLRKSVNARDLSRAQCLLQPLPVFDAQQLPVRRAERATQLPVVDTQTGFDFLRQKYHSVLEVPAGNVLLAIAPIEVGAHLDVGQKLDGVE